MGGYVSLMKHKNLHIHTPAGEFYGLKPAARQLGIHQHTLSKRLNSKDKKYSSYYIIARSKKKTSYAIDLNNQDELLSIANSFSHQDIMQTTNVEKGTATKIALGIMVPDELFRELLEKSFEVPDRLNGYSKRIAKRHRVDYTALVEVVNKGTRGGRPIIPVEEYEKKCEKWKLEIATKYVVYTPGVELLPIYDEYNSKYLGKSIASKVPPSAVYDLRFNYKNPSTKIIRDRLKKYFPKDAKRDSGQWRRDVKKFQFLCKDKSKMHIFYTKKELYTWLNKNYGTKLGPPNGKINGGKGLRILKKTKHQPYGIMWTKGKLSGCAFQTAEAKDKYLI